MNSTFFSLRTVYSYNFCCRTVYSYDLGVYSYISLNFSKIHPIRGEGGNRGFLGDVTSQPADEKQSHFAGYSRPGQTCGLIDPELRATGGTLVPWVVWFGIILAVPGILPKDRFLLCFTDPRFY